MKKSKAAQKLWDAWCIASIVGIWPRFIEPRQLSVSKITLPVTGLAKQLSGTKILHFSDLHISEHTTKKFLDKILRNVLEIKPDLVLFTGDFLCGSHLSNPSMLCKFLNRFSAPLGCFAILGNHDYEARVELNAEGEYDTCQNDASEIVRGFQLLFTRQKFLNKTTERAKRLKEHSELVQVIKKTPFQLLHNQTHTLVEGLNIVGLGDLMLGRCLPEQAFEKYEPRYPGVVLSHHPDSIELLKNYPGEIILSGHTHGGQVNLPWMWKKFTALQNEDLKSGLVRIYDKWIHISRGLGASFPFRWFSIPQITQITLENRP